MKTFDSGIAAFHSHVHQRTRRRCGLVYPLHPLRLSGNGLGAERASKRSKHGGCVERKDPRTHFTHSYCFQNNCFLFTCTMANPDMQS